MIDDGRLDEARELELMLARLTPLGFADDVTCRCRLVCCAEHHTLPRDRHLRGRIADRPDPRLREDDDPRLPRPRYR